MVIEGAFVQTCLIHNGGERRAEVALTTKELRCSCENHFPCLFTLAHLCLLFQTNRSDFYFKYNNTGGGMSSMIYRPRRSLELRRRLRKIFLPRSSTWVPRAPSMMIS